MERVSNAKLQVLLEEYKNIPGPLFTINMAPILDHTETSYNRSLGIINCVNAIPDLIGDIVHLRKIVLSISTDLKIYYETTDEIRKRYTCISEALIYLIDNSPDIDKSQFKNAINYASLELNNND